MAKRILAGILAISMLAWCACGISACANHEKPTEGVTVPADETAAMIESLKKQIAELQTLIKNLTDKYTEDNEALSEQIRKLQEENKKLSDRLNILEAQKLQGRFYTLKEAYNGGLISKADLMSIAYYHNGGRQYNEEIMGEDFVPAPKTPEKLSPATENAIKLTYWYKYFKDGNSGNITLDNIGTGDSYYGTYNGCVIVKVWYNNEPVTEERIKDIIDGVTVYYNNGKQISVWVENANILDGLDGKPVLDKEIEAEIKTAYFNLHKKDFDNCNATAADISIFFCGEYSGSYVMFVHSAVYSYEDAVSLEIIDGVLFNYSSGHKMDVYNNGMFYSVSEAFNQDLLTHNDLLNLVGNWGEFIYSIKFDR